MADAHQQPNLAPDDSPPPKSGRPRHGSNVDAQEMIIASLRDQVQDLFSQVSQLNNKLVQSYDRVSNLEDDLHVASSNLRSSSVKISQLEMERAQHLAALNTGLLVEKSHVTSELSRLMEKATEEAAQRGQAESARAAIEKDLDDLSASLFDQANTMVAEARYARSLSERKVEDAERALKGAEEAVSMMQQQMQSLQAEKEVAEKRAEEMQVQMGKGKWIEKQFCDVQGVARTIRLLNLHAPYQEFLQFVGHLRNLHNTSLTPPAMPTLLQLSFLARLSTEDSEPTVRLDLAPSLNWLSRRSVLSAIHSGQLRIEPISSSVLITESASFGTSTTIAGLNGGIDKLPCALCGSPVFPADPSSTSASPPSHPLSGLTHSHAPSWSSSIFKNMKSTGNGSPSISPPHSPTSSMQAHQQIYIFRLASQQSSTVSSIPIPSLSRASSHINSPSAGHQVAPSAGQPATTIYPLCSSGWCLSRLRTTCCLWAFVRSGIVERIWEEEVVVSAPPAATIISPPASEKPPIPPRKRGIWGIASAISEKAGWGDNDKKSEKSTKEEKEKSPVQQKRLPPPPSSHRPVPPPPVHPSIAGTTSTAAAPAPAHAPAPTPTPAAPPPLPKRSQIRRPIASPAPHEVPGRESVEGEVSKLPAEVPAPPLSSHPVAAPHVPILPPRVSTPSNVPLPDSRPSTPMNVPDRTGSPAAPPPIPRRAAARGSRIIAPGSRPGTPNAPPTKEEGKAADIAGKDSEASSATTSEGLDEAKQTHVNGEAETNISTTSGEADSNKPQVISDLKPQTEDAAGPLSTDRPASPGESRPGLISRVSESSDDVFEDAPAPADEHMKPASPPPQEEATDVETKTPTEAKAFSDQQKGVNLNGVSDDKDVITDSTKESAAGSAVTDAGEAETIKENGSSAPDGEVEGEDAKNFVGDITWEDKTWKELVRLREDMFWARIGGLR